MKYKTQVWGMVTEEEDVKKSRIRRSKTEFSFKCVVCEILRHINTKYQDDY